MSRPSIILPEPATDEIQSSPEDEVGRVDVSSRGRINNMRTVRTDDEVNKGASEGFKQWYSEHGCHPWDTAKAKRPESTLRRLGRKAKVGIAGSISRSRSRSRSRSGSTGFVAPTSPTMAATDSQTRPVLSEDCTSLHSDDEHFQARETESASEAQGLLSPGYQPRQRSGSGASFGARVALGKVGQVYRRARSLSGASLDSSRGGIS
jgi:hypothetical protein